MKKIINILSLIAIVFISSCAEVRFGDGAFSESPSLDGATIDEMFSSSYNADRVLAAAYTYLPYGVPTVDDTKLGANILECNTDLMQSWKAGETDGPVNLYYNGSLSSSINSTKSGSDAYAFGEEDSYYAIRYGWLYVENASKIPDITDEVRKQRVAEAKAIIALSYAEMLRYVGGVPLIDHAIDTDESMEFPRATFAETVEYIVELLDEAAEDLPWYQTTPSVDGARLTRASALGLKLRVLLFAASPTFNSDTKWHSAADEYTCYGDYDYARWEAALSAGEEFFSEYSAGGYYELVSAAGSTHSDYRSAFREAYLEADTKEVLVSVRKSISTTYHSAYMSPNVIFSGPTLDYVNMFDWADGTAFDADNFDWDVDWDSTEDYTIPFFIPVEGQVPGTATRDPRLYETVATPGALCYSGVVAPVYTNATDYQGFSDHTGFYIMKFNLEYESDRNTPPHWPYLRLAEVYLSYAEALNECGRTADAYAYIDAIRQRVGLGAVKDRNMETAAMREYILNERAKEFGMEEVRWFDMVRWGLEDDFKKPLQKLSSTSLSSESATSPTRFTFKVSSIPTVRYWASNWSTKWFLAPIPQTEVNLDYGMTQNPGW